MGDSRFDSIRWANRFESIRGTEFKFTKSRFGRGNGRLLPSSEFSKFLWFRTEWTDLFVNVSQNLNKIKAMLNTGDSIYILPNVTVAGIAVSDGMSAYCLLGVTIELLWLPVWRRVECHGRPLLQSFQTRPAADPILLLAAFPGWSNFPLSDRTVNNIVSFKNVFKIHLFRRFTD